MRLFSIASSILACTLISLASCSQTVQGSDTTLRFTAIPGEDTNEMIEKFGAVAEYLASELSIDVEYVQVSDYAASVEAFKNADIHLSWFGGLTGVKARTAVAGARAIAQGKIDPEYKSYVIANSSSGLEAGDSFPMQLAGHTFTFGDRGSTSGRLMPEHFLRQATGKSPAEFFGSEMHFSNSHDLTWQLVQDGSFDAGVLSYKTYDKRLAEGKIDPNVCRVIWTTPTYPDYSWNAHPELEERFGAGFIDKLQSALINMQDPALLDAMMREEGLISAKNEDFAPLETLARELELLR
ncbi:MAG: phosphonate transport system substrate-binding protein [Planctomycetota bacterium]|jgi:phosphonate transport system substrate-binding protein